MGKDRDNSNTRAAILRAALRCFARAGYAAASVREIVEEARISKPALYYYFKDKAGVFEALVEMAHNERYRLMREAAERGHSLTAKLEEIVAAMFAFALKHQDLMRLAFATAFAPAGEVPGRALRLKLAKRNFEFVRSLVERAQAAGELPSRFSADELAMGIYGQLNSRIMARLLVPACPLSREAARNLVELFLRGALNGKPAPAPAKPRQSVRNI